MGTKGSVRTVATKPMRMLSKQLDYLRTMHVLQSMDLRITPN